MGCRFSAISLAALALLAATVSPAGAATSATGPGVSQENTYGTAPGATGGNQTVGTREGCVKYDASVFHLAWNNTGGSISDGVSTYNTGPLNPFVVTLTVASGTRYEGPHGTYDSSQTGQVTFGAGGGCLVSDHGKTPIASTVTLSVVRSNNVELCNDGVGGPGTTVSTGTIRRGVYKALPPYGPETNTTTGDPDDTYYTITGKCGTASFTVRVDLGVPPTVPGGVCVAPIAPAACVVASSTISQ